MRASCSSEAASRSSLSASSRRLGTTSSGVAAESLLAQRHRCCSCRTTEWTRASSIGQFRKAKVPVQRASERLPQADIDAERRIAVAGVEREADIQPYRSEIGVVARADAGADSRHEQRKIGQHIGIGAAGIDEGHGAERLADPLAKLDARLDDAG